MLKRLIGDVGSEFNSRVRSGISLLVCATLDVVVLGFVLRVISKVASLFLHIDGVLANDNKAVIIIIFETGVFLELAFDGH